jgi:hypothetical protein
VFIGPTPSTGCSLLSRIVARITQQRAVYCLRGNVFIEPPPSSGSIRHNIFSQNNLTEINKPSIESANNVGLIRMRGYIPKPNSCEHVCQTVLLPDTEKIINPDTGTEPPPVCRVNIFFWWFTLRLAIKLRNRAHR